MTNVPIADEPTTTADDVGPSAPAWEFPEIVVVVILCGVVLLGVGGLATGIARSFAAPSTFPSGFDRQFVGDSVQLGSNWASFVLAAVLLGLMGVCWWNLNEWEPEEDQVQSSGEITQTQGHLRRGCVIIVATQATLVLTSAGALAALVGAILAYQSGSGVELWSTYFNVGAGTLAVLIVATTGVLLGRRLVNQYS
jgi:hypothetical protein